MIELRARVRHLLKQQSERWYDGIAEDLAKACWEDLVSLGIRPENYGTARMILCDPTALRKETLLNAAGFGRPLVLEGYEVTMLARYGLLGLREPGRDFDVHHFEAELARAMALIDGARGAGQAVRALVWSMTPVEVEGPDYDTGYSDPALPFSIFIGAHAAGNSVSSIRLAEGILHEAMHLQLSLIEDVVPLIAGANEMRHSPWQGRQRPTQGLLHGLYVFRVVQDWLRALIDAGNLSEDELKHALKRLNQIDEECCGLEGMGQSSDLTPSGKLLAKALLY